MAFTFGEVVSTQKSHNNSFTFLAIFGTLRIKNVSEEWSNIVIHLSTVVMPISSREAGQVVSQLGIIIQGTHSFYYITTFEKIGT